MFSAFSDEHQPPAPLPPGGPHHIHSLKKPLHHKEVSIQRQRIPRYICEIHVPNRPFPSSKTSHFQIEAKCEAIDVKMIFNYDANKTHFHNKGFALRLVLKVRFFETRKWRIVFNNSREILRHASPRVAMSHSSCILSFDLIGEHQNKRFYATEIVWSLIFADKGRYYHLPVMHCE